MDTFNISSVLPNVKILNEDGYYRYIGSLTTPPCSEGIIWSIFRTRINISEWQVFLNKKEQFIMGRKC
jgi:carbonic anhydrase